jgi:hypothetical protein
MSLIGQIASDLIGEHRDAQCHERTKCTATNLTIGGRAEAFFLSWSLLSDRHGPE